MIHAETRQTRQILERAHQLYTTGLKWIQGDSYLLTDGTHVRYTTHLDAQVQPCGACLGGAVWLAARDTVGGYHDEMVEAYETAFAALGRHLASDYNYSSHVSAWNDRKKRTEHEVLQLLLDTREGLDP